MPSSRGALRPGPRRLAKETTAGHAARIPRAVAEGPVVRGPSALVLRCLAPWADEIAHRLHVGGVAGKGEAAEMPAVLDRCQHRVVVGGDIGGGRRVVRVRDRKCHDVAATLAGRAVAAAALVPEAP